MNTSSNIINAKQMDSNSRYLQIALLDDNGTPYDLTGHTARFNALKSDGTHIYNDCVMTDAANGVITVELTDQTLAIGNSTVVADVGVYSADGTEVLTTRTFEIKVQSTIRDDSATESSDEYGAVVTLFQDVWDLRDYIRSIGKYTDDVPEGGEPASVVSLWGAFNQFAAWTKTQSTAAMVDALDNILARVGATNPTSGSTDTLFNYLALLYTSIAKKDIILNGSAIKSVQHGYFTGGNLLTASTSAITINSVATAKSIVIVNNATFSGSDSVATYFNGIALTGSTTLTVYPYMRPASGSYWYNSFFWQVIEFY